MISVFFNLFLYGTIFLSLFFVDYLLGNGFVVGFRKFFCKFACFFKRIITHSYNAPVPDANGDREQPNITVFLTELFILTVTIMILNRYKRYRGKDRIDELLQESKEALKQTNEFLEKWRLRRVPNEYSYLDEEPQRINPLELEVPILHMAIIDTRGTKRQPERGDAGDGINITDSTLLSVTSLLDDELDESIGDGEPTLSTEKIIEDVQNIEFRDRFLWDVVEEDLSNIGDD